MIPPGSPDSGLALVLLPSLEASVERAALLAYGLLSCAAFLAYGWDKLRAKRGTRRVPERTLHALALLGGFAGAWLGMHLFRHKTREPFFGLVLLAAGLLHGAAWGWWFFGRT